MACVKLNSARLLPAGRLRCAKSRSAAARPSALWSAARVNSATGLFPAPAPCTGEQAARVSSVPLNIEPHAVPFGEAAGSRVIEAGARGGNREIQFKEVIAASCGRVVQITGAGRQQAGLKPQHHPYGSFHHLHRYLHGSFEGQARGSIRRKASRRRRSGRRNGVAEVLPGRCPGCKDRALSRFCKSAPPTGRPEPFRRGWEEQEAIRGGRMREMRCRWRERPANSETRAREQKARAEARGRSGTGTGLAACPGQAESVGADRVSRCSRFPTAPVPTIHTDGRVRG